MHMTYLLVLMDSSDKAVIFPKCKLLRDLLNTTNNYLFKKDIATKVWDATFYIMSTALSKFRSSAVLALFLYYALNSNKGTQKIKQQKQQKQQTTT